MFLLCRFCFALRSALAAAGARTLASEQNKTCAKLVCCKHVIAQHVQRVFAMPVFFVAAAPRSLTLESPRTHQRKPLLKM